MELQHAKHQKINLKRIYFDLKSEIQGIVYFSPQLEWC